MRTLLAAFALAALCATSPQAGAGAANAGRLIQVEFRGCQVVHLVYGGYPPGTIVTWVVTQFGREVDRGGFVTGNAPADAVQIVNLRLRTPFADGTDAGFILDGEFAVRRKPQCTPSPSTTVPGGTVATPTTAPNVTSTTTPAAGMGGMGAGGGIAPGGEIGRAHV